ncbi:MAG: tRNA (N6-threonylcarbamoyladenosine(37)-N6)-methyltransferase TrmO [Candidatus Thorarchaeota archaeon]
MTFKVSPIGQIHTPFKTSENVPIQPAFSKVEGEAVVFSEFVDGLHSLEGFSHIILVYWFHRAKSPKLKVRPYLDTIERGLFATRAPSRPNPIGLSVVEMIRLDENKIVFKGADMLDGTPLLDIKPYVPGFDGVSDARVGWLERHLSDSKPEGRIADSRFTADGECL